jgi:flagellar biosynthesis anti-sigma factor FlgM
MDVRNEGNSLSQIRTSQTLTNAAPSAPSTAGVSKPQVEVLAADKTQLSTAASQVAQSANVSDVRLDKVAAIQNALQEGTYQVSAADVAKKVVSALLVPEK